MRTAMETSWDPSALLGNLVLPRGTFSYGYLSLGSDHQEGLFVCVLHDAFVAAWFFSCPGSSLRTRR